MGLGLAAVVALAAFGSGATDPPAAGRVEIALALLGLLGLSAVLWDARVRAAAPPAAWAGVALLALFAAWSALSLDWSIAPDETWLEANRALSYALAAALAIVLGASLRRAPERVSRGHLIVAVAVAVYALCGKAFPWLIDHTADFSRLRAPLAYWNALALFSVMAVPAALRSAAGGRFAGLVACELLIVTAALTYSRGGIAVLVVALGVLLWAAGRERLRIAALALLGLLAAAPAVAVGFARDDLTADGVPVGDRWDDGLIFTVALLVGVALLVAGFGRLRRSGLALSPRARALAAPLAAGAVPLAIALTAIGLALSDRGLGGSLDHAWESFSSVKAERQNDPARVLRTNSGNRWVWWREAAGAWSDRPVIGHGAGSFPLLHLRYRDNALEVRQPHSVPLEWLAETGVVGALLVLGGIALLFAAAVRNLLATTGRERLARGALLAGAAAWLVHLPIDWDWDIPAVTLPALVLLGVGAARPLPPREATRAPAARAGAVAAAALAASALCVSSLLPSLSRTATSQALEEASNDSLERAAGRAESARRLNPLAVEPLFAAATVAERRGRYDEAARRLAEAAERQPHNPAVWARIARFDLLLDDVPGALAAARTLAELDPESRFPEIVARFAETGLPATATGTPLPPE